MKKIPFKKIHIILTGVIIIILLGVSQIQGVHLKSDAMEDGFSSDTTIDTTAPIDTTMSPVETLNNDTTSLNSAVTSDNGTLVENSENTVIPPELCSQSIPHENTTCDENGENCVTETTYEEASVPCGDNTNGGSNNNNGNGNSSGGATGGSTYTPPPQTQTATIITWRDDGTKKYKYPYCPLKALDIYTQNEIDDWAKLWERVGGQSYKEERLNQMMSMDFPGALIEANWSQMWQGKVYERCVHCTNGSVFQQNCRMCAPGQVGTSIGCREEVSKCGNGTMSLSEQCDDGNLVNGDGCSASCEKEIPKVDCSKFTLSGPDEITEQEASPDPITYEVRLNNTGVRITSLSATSEPINNPQVNISGTDMTWKQISLSSTSGVLKTTDAKWYGTPGYPNRCVQTIDKDGEVILDNDAQLQLNNSKSGYKVTVKASLDNGCVAEKSFNMTVEFNSGVRGKNETIPELRLDKGQEVSYTEDTKIFRSLFTGKMYHACVNLEGIRLKIGATTHVDIKGQYRDITKAEENFHAQQYGDSLPWSQGGLKGVEDIANEYFGKHPSCADGSSRREAQDKALEVLLSEFAKINDLGADGYYAYPNPGACWMEKTTKQGIGLLKNVGALDLKCAYPKCDENMEMPESPVDRIKTILGIN